MLNVLIFPIIASWVWGGGWLAKYGYIDFGGSSFHIVGGTCGLVGANFLGPRLGLFTDSLPTTENRIREKLERKEQSLKNFKLEFKDRMGRLKNLVMKYLWKSNQYKTMKDQNENVIIEQTVRAIYRKIFVNTQVDLRY